MIALGGGSGLAPFAPGTAGSLLAVVVWWLLIADLHWLVQSGIVLAAFGTGLLVVDRVVRRYSLNDEPAIVIDEIVGCWAALASVPKSWPWIVAAFALFRLADIAKPWPVSWADRSLSGDVSSRQRPGLESLGIMLDDLIAGVMVAALLLMAQYVL